MKYLSTLVGVIALTLQSNPVLAGWCGNTDAQDWAELSSMYWAGPPGNATRPAMYVLSAPWCPYCAQLFKMLGSRRVSFDSRFVPVMPTNENDRDQIADIVMDGTERALTRVFVQRSVNKGHFTFLQRNFVNEVQEVLDITLKARFDSQVKIWGTPMSFVMREGQLTLVAGMPMLDVIDGLKADLSPSPSPPATRRFLQTGIPQERQIEGNPYAKRDNTRLRVLPDENAVSAVCLQRDRYLTIPPSGVVNIEGKDWLVYKPYRPAAHLRAYALASDFEGWRPRQ